MYRFRKSIVTIWVVFVLVMGYFAFQLPSILSGSGFEMKGSYTTTQDILEQEFNQTSNALILLFEKSENVSQSKFESYIKETIDNVNKVNSGEAAPVQFKDNYAYVSVALAEDITIDKIKPVLHNRSEFKVSMTGGPVIEDEMNKGSQNDLKNAEMIGLPIALIVLLLAFGGFVAAGIPLLTGVISVSATMGALYFLGQHFHLSIFVLNVVPMIGLALSIDFALLYINRFREELEHHDIKTAVSNTTKTAGRSIAFSGFCVALGLSGMLVFEVDIFRSVAIGGIAVVFISVLSSLTFLPALLSLIGNNINRAMIFRKKREGPAQWRRFASFVMKRPIIMALATLAILITALLPIREMELEIPDASALPAKSETRIAYETFEDVFLPSDQANIVFVLKTKNEVMSEQSLQAVEAFIAELKKDKDVTQVDSLFSAAGGVSAKQLYGMSLNESTRNQLTPVMERFIAKNKTLVYVTINIPSTSEKAKSWVRNMEAKHMPLPFTIGGYAKFNQEIFDEIYDKAPLGLLLIIGSTYFILLIAFRSILIPLKAIIMNVFSLGAAFGLVVWIFQEGHFGIHPSAIGLMIPVMAFAVVFGLSMDYEVFLISRIQEEYIKTKDNNFATLEGLTITSRIITAAAAIMIVVTGAFAFTDIIPVKQIGIAVALAIFIDATLVRMILVPSLMKLLGDWNWWFPFKKIKTKKPGE